MSDSEKLGDEVKRYGYSRNKKIKLYGKGLELVSDPVSPDDDNVFVDAREEGTDNVRQVQVPRNVVEMAKGGKRKNNGRDRSRSNSFSRTTHCEYAGLRILSH